MERETQREREQTKRAAAGALGWLCSPTVNGEKAEKLGLE